VKDSLLADWLLKFLNIPLIQTDDENNG
jgi:hypothetical protein